MGTGPWKGFSGVLALVSKLWRRPSPGQVARRLSPVRRSTIVAHEDGGGLVAGVGRVVWTSVSYAEKATAFCGSSMVG